MKDILTVVGFVVAIIFIYGLVDCNEKQGVVIDVGATPDASSPDGGAP